MAASILVSDKNGPFGKIVLALSRDVGTVRVHRDSAALFRCKSGTGPRPGITSASPSIVFVIAALHYIMCSMPRDNDGAREVRGLCVFHLLFYKACAYAGLTVAIYISLCATIAFNT